MSHSRLFVCFRAAQSFCIDCLAAQAPSGEKDDIRQASLLQDDAALATWQCLSCQGRCPCALCKMKYRRQRLGGNKSGVMPIAGQAQAEMATVHAPPVGTTDTTEKRNRGMDLLAKAVDEMKVVEKEVS